MGGENALCHQLRLGIDRVIKNYISLRLLFAEKHLKMHIIKNFDCGRKGESSLNTQLTHLRNYVKNVKKQNNF